MSFSTFVRRLFGGSRGTSPPQRPDVAASDRASRDASAWVAPPALAEDQNVDEDDEPSAAARAFVASVRHLPLFSGTATQLIRSVGRDDLTARELARLVSTDAALVAHLLRITNSPYYGLRQRVATIGDAAAVMGLNQIRRTVTAAILQRPLMTYLHDSSTVHAFWRHELVCAALSRHIALRSGLDGEIAYMAGLMHDVGRLAMLIQFPQHTDLLLPAGTDDDALGIDREVAQFGFDHAQVGGELLELWGLPAPIVRAARSHGRTVAPRRAMSAAVWRANQLAHAMTDAFDDDAIEEPWMTSIGLDGAERRRIADEIRALESDQA